MSEEDFKEKMFKQLEAIGGKLVDVEKKIDIVHSGIYGDINYQGLKKEVSDHTTSIVEIKEIVKPLKWMKGNVITTLIITVVGLALLIDVVMELQQKGLFWHLIGKSI